jgi:triosephosphate isomerase
MEDSMELLRRPLIAGNWKMHKTVSEARALAKGIVQAVGSNPGPEVVICPAFTALWAVGTELTGSSVKMGGQNMSPYAQGAYTGEIAAPMLIDVGATYVIIGHSERRQLFGETDHSVRLKLEAALLSNLTPIVCVGETLEEREGALTDNVIIVQMMRALHGLSPEQISRIVFAYEPVWAIGTGKTCAASEANRVCGIIRETVERQSNVNVAQGARVLYGGSVKAETIKDQMALPHIDGALVGGASLEVASFAAIVNFQAPVTG